LDVLIVSKTKTIKKSSSIKFKYYNLLNNLQSDPIFICHIDETTKSFAE